MMIRFTLCKRSGESCPLNLFARVSLALYLHDIYRHLTSVEIDPEPPDLGNSKKKKNRASSSCSGKFRTLY